MPIIRSFVVLFFLTSVFVSVCYAESLITPHLEIHVPLAAFSRNGITSVKERIISKGTGFKLGEKGVPLNEAAGILLQGVWNGTDFVALYRQKFDIHQDSYLVIKKDKKVAERDYYERGYDAVPIVSVDEFGFSNGNYYTKQGDGLINVRINNGVFTQDSMRMNLDQAFYGSESFVGIEKRGIPIVSYLYNNSEGTNRVKEGKVQVAIPEIVLINNQKLCKYAFTKKIKNGKFTESYFFTMDGNLVKYGREIMEINGNNREWQVSLYDIQTFSTQIPDKGSFINPSDARMVEKNSTWSFTMI
ncbi:MAG: hypothetical protein IKZ43_01185 [Acidaminococcaceae bacterium]|nr:hypothetical protein [Acidaminococcaceae bacterium]